MPNSTDRPAIYVSYTWDSESEALVESIEMQFQKKGLPIVRDKNVLGYKGKIKAFMQKIGKAQYIILVISNKYLRSVNCMFELIEIFKNDHFYERVFPVVLDEVNIYDPSERVRLMKYWEERTESLNEQIRELKDFTNMQGVTDDLNLNSEIRDNIARLTNILKDTNTLSIEQLVDSNFEPLYNAIVKKIDADTKMEAVAIEKEYIANRSDENSQNFVRIKAKLFGTTAFFEVSKKNRRRVFISFGITAVLGICAIFLALPRLSQDSPIEDVSVVETQVGTKDSILIEDEKDSIIAKQTPTKTEEKNEVILSNIRYNVELIVPSDMAQASVFVDGKPAEIVERSPISITVRLRKKDSSHHFEVKDGDESCKSNKLITKDQVRLPLCD